MCLVFKNFVFYFLHLYSTYAQLSFGIYNSYLSEIFKFQPIFAGNCSFFASIIHQAVSQNILRSNAFGVNRHLKIKKARCKSFLGFSLSFDSFRVPKTHPGHNGPPTRVNVIPDHTGNRVKLIFSHSIFSPKLESKCRIPKLQHFGNLLS